MSKEVFDILPKRKDLRKHTLSDDCVCEPEIEVADDAIYVRHHELEDEVLKAEFVG